MSTDLYRFYDDADRLLYVGISLNAAKRASEHRKDKPWWNEVHRMEVEHLTADRHSAEQIEKSAIVNEQPIYNIVHNGAPRLTTEDDLPGDFNATVILDMFNAEDIHAYNALATAMDAIARLCDKRVHQGQEVGSRLDFINVISALARSLVYGSMCQGCYEVRFPVILAIQDRRAQCGYLCPPCDKQWAANWTLDLSLLACI